MVAHFAIPKTASLDTFELVKVPLAGQQKGGYKLVWSTVNGNVKQISETHVYKATSESFTFENMYSVAKDATFSSSQVNGQSVFNDILGKNGLSQYMFAQPTQKYVPAKTSRRLLAFDPKPYLSGASPLADAAVGGSAPATLVECPAGTGVSYSAKTAYQARQCVGCKELHALGDQDTTASASYGRFVATQICDAKTLGTTDSSKNENEVKDNTQE